MIWYFRCIWRYELRIDRKYKENFHLNFVSLLSWFSHRAAIPPILICPSLASVFGCGLIFGTGVLYGMMSLGKKYVQIDHAGFGLCVSYYHMSFFFVYKMGIITYMEMSRFVLNVFEHIYHLNCVIIIKLK